MLQSILKLATLTVVLSLVGCSNKQPVVNVDEMAEQKIAAMIKIAEAVNNPNQEFAVRYALEKYRGVPFQVKASPDAAKKILEIYDQKVKGKVPGELGAEVAGEMDILADESK